MWTDTVQMEKMYHIHTVGTRRIMKCQLSITKAEVGHSSIQQYTLQTDEEAKPDKML